MIKYCHNCVYPDTKPDLTLNENGICDACRFVDVKDTINWELRKKDLGEIFEKFKNKDSSNYDCIIPVSGGKDSTYQTYVVKEEFGLNPLCVSYHLPEFTDLGRKNLENLKKIGVDCLEFTPNPEICKKMQKTSLIEFGDAQWPEHFGIFTVPVQVAVRYKIPLIVWGENPRAEYGGPQKDMEAQYLDRKWCEDFELRVGGQSNDFVGPEIMLKHGIEQKFLNPYIYPSDEEIRSVGVRGIFLGHFIRWNVKKQLEKVQEIVNNLETDDFSAEALLARGTVLSHRNWIRSNYQREQIKIAWSQFFKEWDILICPQQATTAFNHDHRKFSERKIIVDNQEQPYFQQIFWAGMIVNTHLPSTVFPTGPSNDGLPIGLQAVSGLYQDKKTIKFCELLSQEIGGFIPPPDYE